MAHEQAGLTDVAGIRRAANLGEALAAMMRAFATAGLDSPALDARRLAQHALAIDPAVLIREPERSLSAAARERLVTVTSRRLQREPVSRIEGHRAFHRLDLEIGPATLDPRPETETVVDAVLELIAAGEMPGGSSPRILDLGTGSGAILLALLDAVPGARGTGVDISHEALQIAARNAARCGLSDRATFLRSCWYTAIAGTFDVIVSNPPYIPTADIASLDPEVVHFDPVAALDGGPDGLDAYRTIAAGAASKLAPAGWIAVEVGHGQHHDVETLFAAATLTVPRVWPDLAGTPRCVAARARA